MGILDFFADNDERKHQMLVDEAESRFQLKEYGSEIWLTFNGSLVCPCSMLKDDPVEAVKEMRELYVKSGEMKP